MHEIHRIISKFSGQKANQIENYAPSVQFSIKTGTCIKSVILPSITNAYEHKTVNNLGFTKKSKITFI